MEKCRLATARKLAQTTPPWGTAGVSLGDEGGRGKRTFADAPVGGEVALVGVRGGCFDGGGFGEGGGFPAVGVGHVDV